MERGMLTAGRQAAKAASLNEKMLSVSTYFANFLVGWLVMISLGVVSYLVTLEIEERRQNKRMDQERERLGLRRA